MVIFRRFYRLEAWLTEKHFRYLSYMLVAFGVIYLYFTFAEYLTVAYKLEGGERLLLQELFTGRYSLLVWPFFFLGQVVPLVVCALPWTRTIPLLLIASVLVNVGMWMKRYVIVVPSLASPQLPYEWGIYTPTWVELAITLASFAGFAMVFTLFAKLFPIVSVWEIEEGAGHEAATRPAGAVAPAGAALQPGGAGDA
jgi:Ni/Fe-hydrogenase subunit HybB-like protein